MAPRLSLAITKLHVSLSCQVPGSHMQLSLKKSNKILSIMAREQLQNICMDNAATSFLGEQLVAQWPSFFKKKKKKSASCSEVSAGNCCFITESCHIFYGAKLCRRSWETKMKENWYTIWTGSSEQKVMGAHKTQHLLRVKGTRSVDIQNLNISTISDAWRKANTQRRASCRWCDLIMGSWCNFRGMKCVGEWTHVKRLDSEGSEMTWEIL